MKARGIFFRGMAMGAADIVPGVSGGTIAFITGIYPRLLHSLRCFDLTALRHVLRGDISLAWRHVNGGFLAWLAAGILTSILTLAQVLGWVLEHHPEPLWALFFGLILGSALLLLKQLPRWQWQQIVAIVAGTGLAVLVALSPRGGFVEGAPGVFLAGFIAICAMILPGISGSFILLLLGMYSRILAAVREFDLALLGLFALGAGCGLLCFSRFLDWLLSRYRHPTIALLTGFLFGSLLVVWPWKHTRGWFTGSDGSLRPAEQVPILPGDYLAVTGEDPQLLLCSGLALAGFLLVVLIDQRWGRLQVDAQ